ncbi:autotransporter family protein [Hydrogenophaga sp. BPS33]|uniref:autotransporter family protein n=1 Tax=Hydrogenophaga sp. BPS33 TaxID=2651974 RepID=UPI001320348C|nr:autotransporter outer membrane beta-barrel domain-containing protein [Hydrogenophaga sp. BPS33]QHE83682.1 autotransporter outer membrane beta-barrel domain-containing protein [Hydrogenophaga sp. BPS33]
MSFKPKRNSTSSPQRQRLPFTHHRPASTPPRIKLLSLALLAAFSSPAAWAINECGVPAGDEVACNAAGSYASGITYGTLTFLSILVDGINIVRDSGSNFDGLRLVGGGASGTLNVELISGVSITTDGDQSDGISVESSLNNAINIDVRGNITTATTAGVAGAIPTAAASGVATGATNLGSILIFQRSGQIAGSGAGTVGLYGLTEGVGSVSLRSNGRIGLVGDESAGMRGLIGNTNSTATVSATQAATGVIELNGLTNTGVHVSNSGSGVASIEVQGMVNMTGNGSYGAHVESEGLGASQLTSTGTVSTTDSDSHALYVSSTWATNTALHSLTVSGNGTVNTSGGNSHGLRVFTDGAARIEAGLEDNARVTTSGALSHGIDALGSNAIEVATGALTSVEVTGQQSMGVQARGNATTRVDHLGQVTASGKFGVGIYANTLAGVATVNVAGGASVMGGWQDIADDIGPDLQMRSAGVVISSAGTSVLNNDGTIGAMGDRAVFDDAALGFLQVPGNLTVNNNGTITGYLQLAGGGTNTILNSGAGTFELRHFADTNGDGARDTKRIARADFGNGTTSSFSNASTVRLGAVAGNPSTDATDYYVPTTGVASTPLDSTFYRLDRADVVQAQLTNLGQFQHSGTLDLRGAAVGNSLVITSNAAAGSAPGTGTFIANGGNLFLNAVLNDGVNSQADMLIVDRTQLGGAPTTVHVGVDPSSLGAFTPGNGIQLVEVRDKAASAAGVFVLPGPVTAGAYDYQLFHNGIGADAADGNWYLRSFMVLPAGGGTLPTYSAQTPVYMAVPALTSRLGLAMLANYHDRLGDGRVLGAERAEQQAAWGRVWGQSGKTGRRGGSAQQLTQRFQADGPAYEHDLSGLQVGVDLNRQTHGTDAFDTTGVFLGVADIKASVDAVTGGHAGNSAFNGYSLGGYWSRKAGNGAYLDAVYQATYYKGHAASNQGQRIRTRGWGHAVSIEGGLAHELGEGWAMEPQAQLVYQHIDLDRAQDGFARVDFRRNGAWLARMGARLSKQSASGSGTPQFSWLRLNVWHQLGSDARTTFSNLAGQNAVGLNTALGGVWGQLQLGHSVGLSPAASAFATLDYSFSLDGSKARAVGAKVGFKLVW